MPSVMLKPGKERRLLAGHCWVYAGEIAKITGDPTDGDAVDIRDHKDRFLGRGLLNTRSQITVRRFTTQKEELDHDFFRRRIVQSLRLRHATGCGGQADFSSQSSEFRSQRRQAFRVVFSESDLLPGLILDQYGDHLVLQALTLGIDRRKAMIVELARELFQPAAIIERSDLATRRLEGMEETKGVLFGQSDGKVIITIGGAIEANVVRGSPDPARVPTAGLPSVRGDLRSATVRGRETGAQPGPCAAAPNAFLAESKPLSFELNLLDDQKTGFFLDQVENYTTVAAGCRGKRVLDCFSYHGGFALTAARAGAGRVEAVEISEPAVARARRNAERNDLAGRIQFICANAFDVLKTYDSEKRQFDLIVLDPPSFTRTKQNVNDALRGYKEINLRALKMLPPGGVLATFSCSHHIPTELFKAVVLDAAADAHKTLRLLQVLTQSRDHPILPAVPETEYLKGFLLQSV